jgi:hypothetical protein
MLIVTGETHLQRRGATPKAYFGFSLSGLVWDANKIRRCEVGRAVVVVALDALLKSIHKAAAGRPFVFIP